MGSNSTDNALGILIGLIIWIVIIYQIIQSATKATILRRNSNIQTDLLKAIASKHGVSEEEIKQIEKKYEG